MTATTPRLASFPAPERALHERLVGGDKVARFDPERGSLRSWLTTLTHNRSVDRVREETARRRRELHSFESRVADLPSLEETVATSTGAEQVRLELDGLCEKERTAIDLAFYGNRTYRQWRRTSLFPRERSRAGSDRPRPPGGGTPR